jgi:rsbT antagonist protein RsbS
MDEDSNYARVTINLMGGCLVATLQFDLDRGAQERFRHDLLTQLDATRTRQVIFDCSGIEVLDGEDFAALRRTIDMAGWLGARTVIAGLRPGVVSALIDLDVDVEGLNTALTLDDAFRYFQTPAAAEADEGILGETDERPA